ncbi:hypothetical protein D9756_005719 [Leucocoprinus leucothites]|uniref:Uncharacterized protein n=1 Tax=Leucocoprinus leucothites TaxID=201217 RepID=A0A8H5G022_9AGAR|nr:hypothetical protein D9756_005719 [Leucoagaricus leucothites]
MASDAGDEQNPQNQGLQNPPPIRQPPRYRPAFPFAMDDVNNPFQTPQRAGLGPANWNLPPSLSARPARPTMPGPRDRGAPTFDGHPLSLKRFFDEVDYLGNASGLTPAEKIQHTLRYLDYRDYETWKSRPSALGRDWEAFKREITSLYPGADEDQRYTLVDLELLADKQVRQAMQARYQFGEYYRQFVTISDWLLANGEISLRERNNIFLNGFDSKFREKLTSRLRLKNPDHPLHQPWSMESITEAARFFLSSNAAASNLVPVPTIQPQPHFESPTPSYAPQSQFATPAPVMPARETFDMSSLEQFMVSDVFISKLADKLGIRGNHSPAPSSNNSTPRAPGRAYGCIACLDPSHYHQSCPVIADYITRGICKRDEYNRLILMDGTLITNRVAPGRSVKERLDNWLKAQGQKVSTNIVEAFPATSQQYIYTIPDNTHETLTIGEVTVDELEELRRLDAVAVTTLKRAEDIRKRVGNALKPKTGPGVTTRSAAKAAATAPKDKPTTSSLAPQSFPSQAKLNTTPPNITSSTNGPQFHYRTPIEDTAAAQKVLEKGLESTVTLTQRELYAISPDVRKLMKVQVTPRKLLVDGASVTVVEEAEEHDKPAEAVSTLIQSTPAPVGDLVVAKPVMELRTLPVTLEGQLEVNAILDEGSQIIGLRRDLWEKLGLPIHSDQTMLLESANKSCNTTMGLLHNLRVSIGECDFYLQVQVADNTSYEMLLGRPFLALAQANTRHFANGDSHITLVDPNSHSIITVPTKPRIRSLPSHLAPSGF